MHQRVNVQCTREVWSARRKLKSFTRPTIANINIQRNYITGIQNELILSKPIPESPGELEFKYSAAHENCNDKASEIAVSIEPRFG